MPDAALPLSFRCILGVATGERPGEMVVATTHGGLVLRNLRDAAAASDRLRRLILAHRAAQKLHEASVDTKVYLAAHGWFNRMLRPELKKLGWKCVRDGGDSYWSFRVYEYR